MLVNKHISYVGLLNTTSSLTTVLQMVYVLSNVTHGMIFKKTCILLFTTTASIVRLTLKSVVIC